VATHHATMRALIHDLPLPKQDGTAVLALSRTLSAISRCLPQTRSPRMSSMKPTGSCR
jgi:hypothetical protein